MRSCWNVTGANYQWLPIWACAAGEMKMMVLQSRFGLIGWSRLTSKFESIAFAALLNAQISNLMRNVRFSLSFNSRCCAGHPILDQQGGQRCCSLPGPFELKLRFVESVPVMRTRLHPQAWSSSDPCACGQVDRRREVVQLSSSPGQHSPQISVFTVFHQFSCQPTFSIDILDFYPATATLAKASSSQSFKLVTSCTCDWCKAQ